jgi:hypothetical protein
MMPPTLSASCPASTDGNCAYAPVLMRSIIYGNFELHFAGVMGSVNARLRLPLL